jgi:hypothetical protein
LDRRRALAVLIAAAALVAAAAPHLPLKAARWLAPGSDPVATLGREPRECLAADGVSVAIGRAAFRSPLVLGGQAARAGLSCNSCHVNGHDNPHFVFPGVSGAPGTADVTHSLMSKLRGDDAFNPKPIPTLYGSRRTELEAFVRGLVVEEFDGPEPPRAVLAGLVDYVRALGAACGGEAEVTLARRLRDVDAAVEAARAAPDAATARAMLLAARSALGLVAERFPPRRFPRQTAALRSADGELAAILALPAERRQAALAGWRMPVVADAPGSLFDHAELRRYSR